MCHGRTYDLYADEETYRTEIDYYRVLYSDSCLRNSCFRLWSYVSLVACLVGRTGYNGGNHGTGSRDPFDAGTTGGGFRVRISAY